MSPTKTTMVLSSLSRRLEPRTQAADAVVDAQDRAPVGVDHVREVPHRLRTIVGKLLAPLEQRAVDAVPRGHPILDPCGLVAERERARRIRHRRVVERAGVLRLRRVETVRRLVAEDQHPGLAGVIALQPLERHVGHDGRVVPALHLAALTVDVELGGEVPALPLVRHEIVEPRPRLVVVLPHVVLADVGRGIAGVVEHSRKVVHGRGKLGEVVRHAVLVRIHAAQERRTARRAQRRRGERVPEVHALVGDAIDVRGLQVRVPRVPDRVPAQIVEQDEQDVRARVDRRRLATAGCRRCQDQHDRAARDEWALHRATMIAHAVTRICIDPRSRFSLHSRRLSWRRCRTNQTSIH